MEGVPPLRLSDVVEYAKLSGYRDPEDIFFFADVMAACDGGFLQREYQLMKQRQARSKASSKSSARRAR